MEKINISFTDPNQNHIDLYPMKCLDSDPQPNFEFPFDFHIKRGVEIWKMKQPEADVPNKENKNNALFSMSRLSLKNELLNISYSFYRNSTVYNIPSSITLEALKSAFFVQDPQEFKYLTNQQVIDQKQTFDQIK